ncbi:MAG: TonB-dependent receptor [Bacteroidota bacterium]
MKSAALALVLLLGSSRLHAQSTLTGTVLERGGEGEETPVAGANVFRPGTGIGTVTGPRGEFEIPFSGERGVLVVRAVGYAPDTVEVRGAGPVRVFLRAVVPQVGEVEVTGERSSTFIDYLDPAGVQVMTERELSKAACCNLSESFETNPSVDVSFTDAVTGTRQIEMLGLAGTYAQITIENMPAVRGLASHTGLTALPGSWIESIQVSKGVGSAANGYESITGQINVELRKPESPGERPVLLNMFADQDLRLESNLIFPVALGEDWSSMSMLHLGTRRKAADGNGDRFLDMPLARTAHVLQRFHFQGSGGLEGQWGVQFSEEEKQGGTLSGVAMDRGELARNPREYGFRSRSSQLRITGKTGLVYAPEEETSVGLQWSLADYRHTAFFGPRDFEGRERTAYLNLLWDGRLGDSRLRFGAGFLLDEVKEEFGGASLGRTDRVPGLFAEGTVHPSEELTVVAGLRVDRHSMFGVFLTPRLHLRYAPGPDWVVRAVAGRGLRAANVFSENIPALAGSREFRLPSREGYPFDAEAAWNAGLGLTRYLTLAGREAVLSVDFYRTSFESQVVVDLDRSPREIVFGNLAGMSFSNSLQAELTVSPAEGLELRSAYRFLDVRQSVTGGLRERPFTARHRAFLNAAWATQSAPGESRMLYDLTLQWFGRKRLPDTGLNPEHLRVSAFSPDFLLVNAQLTRELPAGLDLYLGVENLLGFRQADPILDADLPGGPYFDSSFVWGPVSGRMLYAGLRWRTGP